MDSDVRSIQIGRKDLRKDLPFSVGVRSSAHDPVSRKVLAVCGPIVEDPRFRPMRRVLIALGLFVWNTLGRKPEEREEAVCRLLEKGRSIFFLDDPYRLDRIVWEMYERRYSLFPDDDRLVLDYQIIESDDGEGVQLNVVCIDLEGMRKRGNPEEMQALLSATRHGMFPRDAGRNPRQESKEESGSDG